MFPGMFVCSAIALLVFLICGPLAIYQGRYHRGSTDQFAAIAGTVALGVGLMWVAEFVFADRLLIPTSVPIAAGAMMVVVKSLENWVRRNLRQRTLSIIRILATNARRRSRQPGNTGAGHDRPGLTQRICGRRDHR